VERKGSEFTFRSVVATVIQVLAADLIRVRAVHATSLSQDHSNAVVKTDWPSVTVGASYDGKYQGFAFEGLRYARHGLEWESSAGLEAEPPDEHYFGFGEKSTPLDKRGPVRW
jgi:hypothetical protein